MPGRPDVADRGRTGRAAFVVAGYTVVALLVGSNLPTPLFPLYARRFGLSALDITLVFATYTLLVIPALVVFAPLSDARGRRPVLGGATVVAAAAAGLFAAADSVWWLYAAQAVQALALGALQGSAAPTLVETDPAGRVRRAAAVASAATLGGAALGPFLAGFLAQYGPLSPRLAYLVEIGLLAVALAGLRLIPPATHRRPWRLRIPEVPRPVRRPFAVAAVCAFVGWSVTGLFLALVPSFVTTDLHHDVALAGAVVTGMLGCSAAAAWLANRLPALSTQAAGIAVLAAGVALLLAASQYLSLAALLAASVLAGVGQGLTFTGSLADVNQIAPADRKAGVVAAYYVVVYLATAVPVIGVGALAGPIGLLDAVTVFAGVVLAGCLAGLCALRAQQLTRRGGPRSAGSATTTG